MLFHPKDLYTMILFLFGIFWVGFFGGGVGGVGGEVGGVFLFGFFLVIMGSLLSLL